MDSVQDLDAIAREIYEERREGSSIRKGCRDRGIPYTTIRDRIEKLGLLISQEKMSPEERREKSRLYMKSYRERPEVRERERLRSTTPSPGEEDVRMTEADWEALRREARQLRQARIEKKRRYRTRLEEMGWTPGQIADRLAQL